MIQIEEIAIKNQSLISKCLDLKLVNDALHFTQVDQNLRELLFLAQYKAGFKPNQPRVPAGNPNGGQWTSSVTEKTYQASKLSVSDKGVEFIAKHEAFRSEVYLDQAGIPTIGYGHKLLANESFPDGISKSEALKQLAKDVEIAQSTIQQKVKTKITQNQFDALTSLTYNIGVGNFANSTLLRELNRDKHNEAADQFLVWNKVTIDGKLTVSNGLTKRREQEREVFLSHLQQNSEI